MSKFVEVVTGFAVNIDSIVSVKQGDEGSLTIETEGREYKFLGDFHLFMDFIQEDDRRKRQQEKMTTQFFGG